MIKKVFSEQRLKELLIYGLIPVLIAVISLFVLSVEIPECEIVESTLESVESSKTTVLEFAGATTATSLAISALPDDFATPLANNFADMGKYFVIILICIFVERLILILGIRLSLLYIIPIACGIYVVGHFAGKELITAFAKRVFILGAALVLVVPCSVKVTNYVGTEYMAYIDETIEETNCGADKINEEMDSGDEGTTIFEKLSEAFKTAKAGVAGLLTYFNNMIRKCMNSIVILIVTNCLMPVETLLMLRWILKEVFDIMIPTTQVKDFLKKDTFKRKEDVSMIKEVK